jgi:hypothetical protein
MKTITLSFLDNRPSTHEAGTVYGFIAVSPESAALMRDEFRPTISSDGIEHWTLEQVATLSRTLESDMKLEIVR